MMKPKINLGSETKDKIIFVDLHGVLLGSSLQEAWVQFLLNRVAEGYQLIVTTNSASLERSVIEKLIPQLADYWSLIFSARAALCNFVDKRKYERVAIIGKQGLKRDIAALPYVKKSGDVGKVEQPDCIVLARDLNANLKQLQQVAYWIEQGVDCVLGSRDLAVPSDNGWEMGPGIMKVIVQSVLASIDFSPIVVGKPSSNYLHLNGFDPSATDTLYVLCLLYTSDAADD